MSLKRYKEILRHLRCYHISMRDEEDIDMTIMNSVLAAYSREEAVDEYLSRIEGINTFRGIVRLNENGEESPEQAETTQSNTNTTTTSSNGITTESNGVIPASSLQVDQSSQSNTNT